MDHIRISTFIYWQRTLLVLCLVFLSACSSKKCREWEIQLNMTRCPSFNSGRLFLDRENDHSYIELEIVRSRSGLRMYINILFLQALPYSTDSSRTKAEISFENEVEPWLIYPFILEGGQRLLIPTDVSDYLIQKLQEGNSFTIRMGRYQTTIISSSFDKVYQELMGISIS